MAHALLLSIHPRHARAIREGRKTVELRRMMPSRCVRGTRVYLYETSPTQIVRSYFISEGCFRLPMCEAWHAIGELSGVSREDFDAYFAGLDGCTGIYIGKVHNIEAMPLHALTGFGRPPQNFRYFDDLGA